MNHHTHPVRKNQDLSREQRRKGGDGHIQGHVPKLSVAVDFEGVPTSGYAPSPGPGCLSSRALSSSAQQGEPHLPDGVALRTE